jgi:hypothetical protein
MTIIYLYVKTHHVKNRKGITLKYFGKTSKDPFKYPGSGKYWKLHCKKYGRCNMDTEIIGTYDLETQADELEKAALGFSKYNNIMESKGWANLKPENGLDGAMVGHIVSDKTKTKMSAALMGNTHSLGFKHTQETKDNLSAARMGNTHTKGHKLTQDHKDKIGVASIGKPKSAETKAKMSAAHLGRKRGPQSEAHKTKISAAHIGNTYAPRKLTEDNVRTIRSSTKTNVSLAKKFGVSNGAIFLVRHRKTWKHVK